uniref:NADH-ubiquinone oxidoreductase chain 6 n=1 Tax=Ornebius fuscicerci TaxID=2153492 RepID=A0A385I218_9ORTH|nr:NADH dehydrogenase subunit 6 [Ornebius fuscicerci]AXY63947.1 NADH dehydrogenase subunit 6 [Ornebius fuscicerci]
MMIKMTLYLMFIMNQLFMFSNHPLSSTIMIIFQTLFMCFMIGELFLNFWYSYILFLIFLGGMLVIFIYMTSLTPNIMFSSQKINIIYIGIMFLFMFFLIIMLIQINFNFIVLADNSMMNNMNFHNYQETSNTLINLFSESNFKMTWFLMLYLLITLIMVTKISNISKGPLRQMN